MSDIYQYYNRHAPILLGIETCLLLFAQSAYNLLIYNHLGGGGLILAPTHPAAAQEPCAASIVACMKYRCGILLFFIQLPKLRERTDAYL